MLFAERDGVIAAAEEAGMPVIGMMVDQQDLAPQNVVTSLVWNMQPTIEARRRAGVETAARRRRTWPSSRSW